MEEGTPLSAFYRNKQVIALLLIGGAIICVGLGICTSSVWSALKVEKGSIVVKDAFLTAEVTPNGNTGERAFKFPADTHRIWCIVEVEAPRPVQVGVRWYYQGELLLDQVQVVSKRGGWYIEPPPGEYFPVGEYRVEVYLVKRAVRTLYFEVVRTVMSPVP
jgi:hypothetical protein